MENENLNQNNDIKFGPTAQPAVEPTVNKPVVAPVVAPVVNPAPILPSPVKQGEEEMAEVDTSMLAGQHADIRREAAEHAAELRYDVATRAGDIRREVATGIDKTGDLIASTSSDVRLEQQRQAYDLSRQSGAETNEIVKEGLKGGFETRGDIKDTRLDIMREVDRQGDRLDSQATAFYIANQANNNVAARDLATLTALTEANAVAMRNEIALNVEKVGAATALQAEKIATAVALGQAGLARDIFMDGDKTRSLINDLKYHDLNRSLIERNSELVEERNWGRHWYHGANQAQFGQQFAQLQSQMQNFNSQLAETRQGMVNFGNMTGVGQSATSNNVR